MHRFVKGELNWVEPLNQNFEEAAAHAAAQDNPHGVTAEQLGAPTKAYVDAQLSNKADVEGLNIITEGFLADGFSAYSTYTPGYTKDTLGYVHFWAVVKKEPGNFHGRTVLGVLPMGFRPPMETHIVGLMWAVGTETGAGISVAGNIFPNGEIVLYAPYDSQYNVASLHMEFCGLN